MSGDVFERRNLVQDNRRRNMSIQPKKPSRKAAPENFTGEVWADDLVRGEDPSQVRMAAVHFAPGARTAWHSHSLGQALYVTEGEGRVQARGEDVINLHPGDVVVTPAHEWHWHGASPGHFFTHLSITEEAIGSTSPKTVWGDKVTDAEYK
jgi:quercetin dioxygenase-like cupin family protein